MDAKDSLRAVITRLWSAPTPADLWALQAPLLALGTPEARAAHAVTGKFYNYLSLLEAKLTSKRYSQFAAMLAAGAVTTIGLDDVLAGGEFRIRDLLVAGLAGALEVTSAVQSVKAWETDTGIADLEVAWDLYGMIWDLSVRMQPDLPHAERTAHLERVLAPITAATDTPDPVRAALIIRLFQVVLLVHLLPLFLRSATASEG